LVQLESAEGCIGEEVSKLSNKASSLDSISARRAFSFLSCSVSLLIRSISLSICSLSLSSRSIRLSLASALICASTVGCQFNFANQRRQRGKEERNSDLLIDSEADVSEEIDMAVGRKEGDQNDQQAADQGSEPVAIEQRHTFRVFCHEPNQTEETSLDIIHPYHPGGGARGGWPVALARRTRQAPAPAGRPWKLFLLGASDILQQQGQGLIQLESAAGGIGEVVMEAPSAAAAQISRLNELTTRSNSSFTRGQRTAFVLAAKV